MQLNTIRIVLILSIPIIFLIDILSFTSFDIFGCYARSQISFNVIDYFRVYVLYMSPSNYSGRYDSVNWST